MRRLCRRSVGYHCCWRLLTCAAACCPLRLMPSYLSRQTHHCFNTVLQGKGAWRSLPAGAASSASPGRGERRLQAELCSGTDRQAGRRAWHGKLLTARPCYQKPEVEAALCVWGWQAWLSWLLCATPQV